MSTWFYYDNNGQKRGPITGGQLKELAQTGVISPETIVENEEGKSASAKNIRGLTFGETVSPEPTHYEVAPFAGQKPADPFAAEKRNPFQSFGNSQSFGENHEGVSEPARRGFRDPGRISLITGLLIVLALMMNVIAIPGNMIQRDVVLKIQAGAYETEAERTAATNTADTIQGITGLVSIPVKLAAGIFFLVWTYRIVKNAHCLTYRPLRFGAGWAVGYYFIPILCLFRPYQALSDAHRTSKNPGDWMAAPGSYLLGWWWAIFILTNMAGRISGRLWMITLRTPEEGYIDALLLANAGDTIVNLTFFPVNNLLALLVVWKLCSSQREAYQQVIHSPPPVVPEMYARQLQTNTWLVPERTSSWAIAAGYAGMFAVLFFPAPIALVLGIIALRDCNIHSTEGKGRAIFAIIMGTVFTLPLLVVITLLIIEGTMP